MITNLGWALKRYYPFLVVTCAHPLAGMAPAPQVDSPPPFSAEAEQALDRPQMAPPPCTERARAIAAKYPDVILESEKVSYSETFGYIFRFSMVDEFHDLHDKYEVHSVLVIWSPDCKTFQLATYPSS